LENAWAGAGFADGLDVPVTARLELVEELARPVPLVEVPPLATPPPLIYLFCICTVATGSGARPAQHAQPIASPITPKTYDCRIMAPTPMSPLSVGLCRRHRLSRTIQIYQSGAQQTVA
jgi:hypothetical protein